MKCSGWTLILFLVFSSCSKEIENESINHKPAANFVYTDEIDHFQLVDKSEDIDGDALIRKWYSLCDTIRIVNYYSVANPQNYPCIFLPESSDTILLKVKLVVSDGHLSDSIIKDIRLPIGTKERRYGLGRNLDYKHCNNVSYNWYFDQMGTGVNSSMNCGPASATMAIKWADESFTKTPEDARNAFPTEHGGWSMPNIAGYLEQNSISYKKLSLNDIDSIQPEINKGNIAIISGDMIHIRSEWNSRWHVDKFYPTGGRYWGHFMVVKGYKIVDGQTLYEVYDPASFGAKYEDGTFKGKDRYYRRVDLDSAVITWEPNAIIVTKAGSGGM